jgi:hypothetical protein
VNQRFNKVIKNDLFRFLLNKLRADRKPAWPLGILTLAVAYYLNSVNWEGTGIFMGGKVKSPGFFPFCALASIAMATESNMVVVDACEHQR